MKFVSNTLYITFSEAVDAGIPESTIKAAKHRGSESWKFINDPADKRKVLIELEALTSKNKSLIYERFGDPYEYAGVNQLKPFIKTDHSSVSFLVKFRLEDGTALSEKHLKEYIDACNILNFISKTDKRAAKEIGFPDKNKFTEAVIALIKNDGVDLPTSYRRLMEAVREFESTGASSVISKKLGNQNRSKVKDELALALLKKLIEHPNKLGDFFIAGKFNEWAKNNSRELISKSTVGNYRREFEFELLAGRSGEAAYRNKFDKIIHRERPSAPLLLINSDDNVLDLYFIRSKENKQGHHITDYYHRFVLYVVTDAFNDYPLGYAIGNTVTKELIKDAYRNAAHHIKSLTGSFYSWQQIITDRWGINPSLDSELALFFKQQGAYTPAKFSNARSKHIEQSFGVKWHSLLKTYSNYAGHNITAVTKTNREAVEINKDNFPTIEQAPAQIAEFIERVRRTIDQRTGKSKQELWVETFNALPENKKRSLSDEERLMWFGKQIERSSRITNAGVQFTLKHTEFTYDVPEEDYMKFVGTTGNVIYDSYDANKILFIADDAKIRIICNSNELTPSALADFKEGDGKLLNDKIEEKKRINQKMLKMVENRNELLERAEINTESILQAGVLSKQIAHESQINYSASQQKQVKSGSVKRIESGSEEDVINRL